MPGACCSPKSIRGAAGWMQTTAGSWYVLTEAGSTTTLSFFVIASMTPSLFLNPVGGRLMQSYSPVAMVKVLAPLAALASLLIAGLYATGTLSIPLLFALTVVGASFRALQAPTFAKTPAAHRAREPARRRLGLLRDRVQRVSQCRTRHRRYRRHGPCLPVIRRRLSHRGPPSCSSRRWAPHSQLPPRLDQAPLTAPIPRGLLSAAIFD